MENTATPVQGMQVGRAYYQALNQANGMTAPDAQGVFAALLELLSAEGEGAEGLLELAQETAGFSDGEEQSDYALQMAAQALFGMPPDRVSELMALMQGQQADSTGIQSVSEQMLSPLAAQQPQMFAKTAQQTAQQSTFVVDPDADGQQPNMVQFQVVQGSRSSAQLDSVLDGESQFHSAVLEAQKLLKSTRTQSQEQPLDIEALQQQVDANRFNNVSAAQKVSASLEAELPVIEQVRTGIERNLIQGKDEFVVKLKPDGLGEITVRVVEEDNKLSLSLIASSAQTAKLLNSELGSLRESLRPLQAQVNEVLTQTASGGYDEQQQFAQQFTGQFRNGEHQGRPSYINYSQADEQERAAATVTSARLRMHSELDAYI